MAKFDARGRTERARWQRTAPASEDITATTTYALMSDGALLERTRWARRPRRGHASRWTVLRRYASGDPLPLASDFMAKLGAVRLYPAFDAAGREVRVTVPE